MTEIIVDSVLDDDRVKDAVCQGCQWCGMSMNDPNSMCSWFDEDCEHYEIVREIEDRARAAAEMIAEAVS